MEEKRIYYKYYFKLGFKVIRVGFTRDLDKTRLSLMQHYLEGHIVQIGGKSTKAGAKKWAKKRTAAYPWIEKETK